ncbi:hypothetical protein WN944_022098 [Citrus x changshan-huyou]|uniref:Uncharacterized protein n=1 Tax=Citrus x changshan-huyou TaxID=2935761 RepID=A0AAP0R311_9ROSI
MGVFLDKYLFFGVYHGQIPDKIQFELRSFRRAKSCGLEARESETEVLHHQLSFSSAVRGYLAGAALKRVQHLQKLKYAAESGEHTELLLPVPTQLEQILALAKMLSWIRILLREGKLKKSSGPCSSATHERETRGSPQQALPSYPRKRPKARAVVQHMGDAQCSR